MRQELKEIEVKIRALIVDPNSGSPVLVLKDINSEDMVPIWVGACEANAIASAIENIPAPRPMTHDLIKNLISQINLTVSKIIITELKENTYYSIIELLGNSSVPAEGESSPPTLVYLDARPSDAIALALRCGCPVYVSESIIKNNTNSISNEPETADNKKVTEDWPDLLDDTNDFSM